MINENLKILYKKMFNENKSNNENIDDLYCLIQEHCSSNPDLWDLSNDVDGSIHESYSNDLYDFLDGLYK